MELTRCATFLKKKEQISNKKNLNVMILMVHKFLLVLKGHSKIIGVKMRPTKV
jgi:hypothetical protein